MYLAPRAASGPRVGYRPPEERLYYNTVGCEASKILLKLGDAVHLKSPSDEAQRPYVASVQAMYQDRNSTDKMIVIAWYFRPEELKGGRTPAHGKVSTCPSVKMRAGAVPPGGSRQTRGVCLALSGRASCLLCGPAAWAARTSCC